MLYLVRHGEADGNRDRRFIGQQDVPLSDLGHRQAARVAERLATSGVERIVSSDLCRAADTARPLADALGLPVHLEAGLREVDNGEWTGLLPDEIAAGWPEMWADYRAGVDVSRPGGERWADVAARSIIAAEALLSDGVPTAVFTHGGPVLCLTAWASGSVVSGNVFAGPIAPPTNGSIAVVVPGPRLAAFNDTGHLGPTLEDDGRLSFME